MSETIPSTERPSDDDRLSDEVHAILRLHRISEALWSGHVPPLQDVDWLLAQARKGLSCPKE
jgi:hypothetical protein